MEDELENPATATATATATAAEEEEYADDVDDSCCSTPFVSAPSSPGRDTPLAGFYYSAPASPTHFVLSTVALKSYASSSAAVVEVSSSFEFDLSSTFPSTGASSPESMTSADELFFNGQIRPMKLSAHLQRPQLLAPLIESDDAVEEDQTFTRGRDLKLRTGSLRRRTRSMSPHRTTATTSFQWRDSGEETQQNNVSPRTNVDKGEEDKRSDETAPCASRSSSAGRSSRRWVFLKEFLYRSKSEGRNEGHRFWSSLSFSPVKEKEKEKRNPAMSNNSSNSKSKQQQGGGVNRDGKKGTMKQTKIVSKRRNGTAAAAAAAAASTSVSPSAHELHYTANRAQAEEMRKKTFLPYRQGLLGCLGFSSKSYTAMNGFARALNPVSSR
ncbi:uncharacterized protein LOC127260512 [Andrographis paniculata]|uniref:uncharacterized protein LOC127260512 n=1 Tax=Andrographis paniculata TaxID=175694 RepID=UPI0021E90AEB|nr:uncharacterized protein LOC127260512 [Andrographis paniculata]